LAGGEVTGVQVQGIGGPAGIFHDDGVLRHPEALGGQRGDQRHGRAGLIAALDHPRPEGPAQLLAELVHRCAVSLGTAPFQEHGLGHRDLEGVRAAFDEILPVGRFDVVRLNLQQHLGIEIQALIDRQAPKRIAIAAVVVAARHVVVQPGELEAALERPLGRELPHAVLVEGQRFAPPSLLLQLHALTQKIVDLDGRGDRRGRLGKKRLRKDDRRQQGTQQRTAGAEKTLSSHSDIRHVIILNAGIPTACVAPPGERSAYLSGLSTRSGGRRLKASYSGGKPQAARGRTSGHSRI